MATPFVGRRRELDTLSQVYELIRVITPNGEVLITQPGIFRINAIGSWQTDLLVRKGEAKPTTPASESTAQQDAAPPLPKGTKNSIALTVRLDLDRYHRLTMYGARFAPRRSNQEILVAALDAYLDQIEDA